MKKFIIPLTLISFLIFSGCADIATKDDIDIVKEKVSNVEDDFYATVKQIAERFQNIENDYNQKITNINNNLKELSDKILVLNNEINSLKEEIKVMKGKIDELKFEYDEKLKKMSDDYTERNLEIKRDIEGLKKAYNDLISTTSNLNKNLSSIQADILNLRDSQVKIVESYKDLPQKIENIEKKINENNQIILEELTKHESEIYQIKKEVFGKEAKEISGQQVEERPFKSILKSEKPKYYIVQKGDYLTKIAKKFDTSVSEIKKLNNLKSDTVYPGQKLLIP
jgi:LysM repeat protein